MIIADNLSKLVDDLFGRCESIDGGLALLAIYAFAFQIYCDFSGYTDIARGVARCLGFELTLNFNLPYFSASPKEFWTRWHISLSTWLRDYLYIPLGGSRGGRAVWAGNGLMAGIVACFGVGLYLAVEQTETVIGWKAAVPHLTLYLAIGLVVALRRPAGDPRAADHDLPEPDADDGPRRPLARRRLDLRRLGGLPGAPPDRPPDARAPPRPAPAGRPDPCGLLEGALHHRHLPPRLRRLAPLPGRVDGAGRRGCSTPSSYHPGIPQASYLVPVLATVLPLLAVQAVQYATNDQEVVFRFPWYARSAFYTMVFYGIVLGGEFGGKQFIYFQF